MQCKMQPPKIYIMIENPSKSNNLGPILRCGAAYSATFVFIGYQKCAFDGSHGAHKHVEILSYPNFQQAVDYVRNSCGVKSIVGILGDVTFRSNDDHGDACGDDGNDATSRMVHVDDLDLNTLRVSPVPAPAPAASSDVKSQVYPCSKPIHTRPFSEDGNFCFLIHKKSTGLPKDQGAYCDAFVHISTAAPIVSSTNHALYGLLDCQTCLSICLHHYAAFAGYKERDFVGQKFQVTNRTVYSSTDIDHKKCQALQEQRRNKKLEIQRDAQNAWENGEPLDGMFQLFG